jgi:hypothetical protein
MRYLSGAFYATIAGTPLTGAVCYVATVLKEGGPTASTSARTAGQRRVHGSLMISITFLRTLCFNFGALFRG